jgi:uncharacterized protein (DUF2237 family)
MDDLLGEVLARLGGAMTQDERVVLKALAIGGKQLALAGTWLEALDESLCPQVDEATRKGVLDAIAKAHECSEAVKVNRS